MRLFRSIVRGTIITAMLIGLAFGLVHLVVYLEEADPIYSLMLIIAAVWVFCTTFFYFNK